MLVESRAMTQSMGADPVRESLDEENQLHDTDVWKILNDIVSQ
jgi:hypothetical protein